MFVLLNCRMCSYLFDIVDQYTTLFINSKLCLKIELKKTAPLGIGWQDRARRKPHRSGDRENRELASVKIYLLMTLAYHSISFFLAFLFLLVVFVVVLLWTWGRPVRDGRRLRVSHHHHHRHHQHDHRHRHYCCTISFIAYMLCYSYQFLAGNWWG